MLSFAHRATARWAGLERHIDPIEEFAELILDGAGIVKVIPPTAGYLPPFRAREQLV